MKKRLTILMILMIFIVALPAQAAFYTDQAAWEAAAGKYASVDLSGLATGYTSYSSIAMGDGQTLSFALDVQAAQVGTDWATWSGGRTPVVLWSAGQTSVTGTFSAGYTAFGLYAEPNPYQIITITLTTDDGYVSQDINGDGGAAFLGYLSATNILSWTLSSASDFAFGEMEYGGTAVPEPLTLILLGLGITGIAGMRRVIS